MREFREYPRRQPCIDVDEGIDDLKGFCPPIPKIIGEEEPFYPALNAANVAEYPFQLVDCRSNAERCIEYANQLDAEIDALMAEHAALLESEKKELEAIAVYAASKEKRENT